MKTRETTAAPDPTLAKPLAPEDVRPGDYVAVLHEELQYAAIAWICDPGYGDESRVIPVRLRPQNNNGPLRVVDVCLPFVFVKPPKGEGSTLDLRAVRLARLDAHYGKRVSTLIAGKPKKKRRRRK